MRWIRAWTARQPYTTDMTKFEEAVLATMYKNKVLIGDLAVSEQEVQDFYESSISPETEFNDDTKLAIEAKLRKQKLDERKASLRERLREGVEITIDTSVATLPMTAVVQRLTSSSPWVTRRSAGAIWRRSYGVLTIAQAWPSFISMLKRSACSGCRIILIMH